MLNIYRCYFIYYEFACLLDMFDVAEPEEGGMEVVDL